jgi:hypothetical protein
MSSFDNVNIPPQ